MLVIPFWDMSPKARETKGKIKKQEYTKLKAFCTVKETINKMKRPPIKCEEVYASNI